MNRVYSNDYFMPLFLYPEDVLNIGSDGGSWHFEPHKIKESYKPTKFFQNASGNASLYFGPEEKDFSTGVKSPRKYSFGKNSWMQWSIYFAKSISTKSLEVQVTREPSNPKSSITMDHKLTLISKTNPETQYTILFSTPPSSLSLVIDSYMVDAETPVELPAGEYNIRLTELKDSDPTLEYAEKIIKIVIRSKIKENGFTDFE